MLGEEMRHDQPRACPIGEVGEPMPWSAAVGPIADARTYWVATVDAVQRPHVMPVLGVWVDDALHFASAATTHKSRNLVDNPACTASTSNSGLDLVVEGTATVVRDTGELQRVADAFRSKYGWSPTVEAGAFCAEFGAPTAGPGPWDVHAIIPGKVFALPTTGHRGATKWTFPW